MGVPTLAHLLEEVSLADVGTWAWACEQLLLDKKVRRRAWVVESHPTILSYLMIVRIPHTSFGGRVVFFDGRTGKPEDSHNPCYDWRLLEEYLRATDWELLPEA